MGLLLFGGKQNGLRGRAAKRVTQRVCFRLVQVGVAVRPYNEPDQRSRPRFADDAGLKPGPYKCSGKTGADRPAGTREALPGTKIEQRNSNCETRNCVA